MSASKPTYREKLLDQRWQKKRLKLLSMAHWCCLASCSNEQYRPTLHVHHKVYFRGRDPWDYPDWAYTVLCDQCHAKAHDKMDRVNTVLAHDEFLTDMVIMFFEDKSAGKSQWKVDFEKAIEGFKKGFYE